MSNNSTIRGCRTSAIQLATKCPFACQKIYRDKIVGSKNFLALFGTAAHNILEEYGDRCLQIRADTDFDFFDRIKGAHIATLPEHMQEEGMDLADRLKERINFNEDLRADQAFIERRFFLDENLDLTDDTENYYFTSGIDRYFIVDDCAFISDYKSSRQIYPPSIIKANLQKDFYSLLVMIAHPEVMHTAFSFDFIRYGYSTKPVEFHREEDFERLRAKLRDGCANFYKLMNSDENQEARPSGFCGLCEVIGLCPAVKNALRDEWVVSDKSKAINAARQLKAAKLFIQQLEAGLKAYVAEKGNIPISGTEQYGLKEEEKTEIDDKQGLYQALVEKKVPLGAIFDAITMPKGKVEKLIKRSAPELDLKSFVTKRKTSKFMYQDLEYGNDSDESQEDG